MSVLGLHHITLVCADAQRTVDFYTRVLGLRLVKQTVNFDDPGSYHLYFGDGAARPGSGDHLLRVAGRAARALRASAARITSRCRWPTTTGCCSGSGG